MRAYVLDTTALLALGAGHQQLSRIVTAVHETRDFHAFVPVLCLAAAEAERAGIADHVGSLPGIDVAELAFAASAEAGRLIRGGVDWRWAHAVVTGRPTVDWPGGRPVVTTDPERYEEHGVMTIRLRA